MDKNARVAIALLFMDALLTRAGAPQTTQELEESMSEVRRFTDDLIGNLRDMGTDSLELEAELRGISDELLEAMDISEETFVTAPPSDLARSWRQMLWYPQKPDS